MSSTVNGLIQTLGVTPSLTIGRDAQGLKENEMPKTVIKAYTYKLPDQRVVDPSKVRWFKGANDEYVTPELEYNGWTVNTPVTRWGSQLSLGWSSEWDAESVQIQVTPPAFGDKPVWGSPESPTVVELTYAEVNALIKGLRDARDRVFGKAE